MHQTPDHEEIITRSIEAAMQQTIGMNTRNGLAKIREEAERIIADQFPDKRIVVVCDETNNSAEDTAAGMLRLDIHEPVEFPLTLRPGSV